MATLAFINPNTVRSVVIILDNGVHPEPAILSPIRLTRARCPYPT